MLGKTKSERITAMISSILAHSEGDVGVGAEENEAFLALKDFMYANVYVDRSAKREEQKVEKVLTGALRVLPDPHRTDVQLLPAAGLSGRTRPRSDGLYQRHER